MQESGDGKPPAPANPAAATADVNNNAREDKLSTELPMLRKELLRDEFSQDQRRVIMSQFLLDIARRDNHILKVGGTAQPTLASINISIHPSIHPFMHTHSHTHTHTHTHIIPSLIAQFAHCALHQSIRISCMQGGKRHTV